MCTSGTRTFRLTSATPVLVSAHQPAYLPWPGLLAKVRDSDLFVILDTVQASKGDFSNRNRIKAQNGVQWLTVPVYGPRSLPFRQVRIDQTKRWKRKHWRTVELAYAKAPYWDYYRDTITSLLSTSWPMLVDLDEYLFRWMLKEFGITTQVVKASVLTGVNGVTGSTMLLQICRATNADGFLFGSMGRNYADLDAFDRAGIATWFQRYQPREYPQLHGAFVPGLSALDMLLNVGPEKARELL